MSEVWTGESTPPVFYALAWVWTQLVGTGEFGLRSISAAAGVATVPVAYLIGRRAARPAGRALGGGAGRGQPDDALVLAGGAGLRAGRPLRGALGALLAAGRTRAARGATSSGGGSGRGWRSAPTTSSPSRSLAEALMLLRRRGLRTSLVGLAILAGCAIAVAPVAIHQMSLGHADWIGNFSLGHRLWETASTFVTGETGDIIAPARAALARDRAAGPQPRRAGAAAAAGGGTGAARRRPAAAPLRRRRSASRWRWRWSTASKDFVLARNLIPALVPLLAAIGIAVSSPASRRLGAAVGALLFAYSLGFCILASTDEEFQRPNWSAVAEHIGDPHGPRATVTWTLGEAPLRYYLSTGAIQVAGERTLRLAGQGNRLRLRRGGAGAAARAARPGLPPGRRRRHRPPLHPPLPLPAARPGAAAAAPAARGAARFPLQRRASRRRRAD